MIGIGAIRTLNIGRYGCPFRRDSPCQRRVRLRRNLRAHRAALVNEKGDDLKDVAGDDPKCGHRLGEGDLPPLTHHPDDVLEVLGQLPDGDRRLNQLERLTSGRTWTMLDRALETSRTTTSMGWTTLGELIESPLAPLRLRQ